MASEELFFEWPIASRRFYPSSLNGGAPRPPEGAPRAGPGVPIIHVVNAGGEIIMRRINYEDHNAELLSTDVSLVSSVDTSLANMSTPSQVTDIQPEAEEDTADVSMDPSNVEQDEPQESLASSKAKNPQVRNFLVTINKLESMSDERFLEDKPLVAALTALDCKYWSGQWERGGNTMRLHCHFFVQLKDRVALSKLRKTFAVFGTLDFQFVKATKNDFIKVDKYVRKLKTRVKGPISAGVIGGSQGVSSRAEQCFQILQEHSRARHSWQRVCREHGDIIFEKVASAKEIYGRLCEAEANIAAADAAGSGMLLPWQSSLLSYIRGQARSREKGAGEGSGNINPDDRSILWLYDPRGGSGKTTFGRRAASEFTDRFGDVGVLLLQASAKKDLALAFAKAGPMRIHTVIFDLCRQQVESDRHLEYLNGFMEGLKDGVIFSPKYDSQAIRFPPKTVIVLSNEKFRGNLSSDRIIQLCFKVEGGAGGQVGDPENDPWEICQLAELEYNAIDSSSAKVYSGDERNKLKLVKYKEVEPIFNLHS